MSDFLTAAWALWPWWCGLGVFAAWTFWLETPEPADDDPIRPARGCMTGLLAVLTLVYVVALIVWLV